MNNKLIDEAFECPECKLQTLFLVEEIVCTNGNVGYTYQCANEDCSHKYNV
jgi:hypothetical protein